MNNDTFIIDGWLVTPAEGTLSRDGKTLRLEPKVMEVLAYFATRPGEVITRKELERDVWRGALVGYDAVTSTVIKLRKALQDDARKPHIIATVPKRGYKLLADIEHTSEPVTSVETLPTKIEPTTAMKDQRSWLVVIVISLIAAIVIWTNFFDEAKPLPSLLVLPFKNQASNTLNTELIDGFTEDMITDLSRLSNLTVFASSTSLRFKDQDITPKQINEELGADYVIQGSLRRQGHFIRINVELIDTQTGLNKWAERYERNIEGIFEIQREIAKNLIRTLSIDTSAREKENLEKFSTRNFQAYEYFLQGQSLSKVYTQKSNEQAREAYKQAITLDPGYGRAYGTIAFTLAVDFLRGWTNKPIESLDRALALAEKGVELNHTLPQTYWSLGYVHLMRKEFDKAEKAVYKSIQIAPNYADGYGLLALIHNNIGNPQKALDYVNRGMKLNPYYTWDYLYNKGRAYYHLGQVKVAIPLLEQASERNENVIPVKLMLAACYIRVNRKEDAEWVIEQLRILNPSTTLKHIEKSTPIVNDKLRAEFLDDLRLAGLPES